MLDEKTKAEAVRRISEVVGPEHVTVHETDRVLNAHDAWPLSEAKIRAGEILPLADMVVFPNSTEEVSEVLKIANDLRIPVVPVGGGAGTCGGTLPIYGGIQLDLKRMNRIIYIDDDSMTVRVQAGVVGIDLEEAVNKRGYTTGHTPTSLRASNVGGFIATRSGGSMSSLYGKIEDMTLGLQVVLADGSIVECKAVPRHSVGPDLKQLFIGSEGTLCVITEATLKLFPLPEERRFRTIAFRDVHTGLEAIRHIFHRGVFPSVVRLYDPEDAAMSFSTRFPIDEGNCVLLLAFDGTVEQVRLDEQMTVEICMGLDGKDLGQDPARYWWEHRYDMYYPTKFTTAGYSIGDTIDIVATYDRLERVYYAMKEAMEAEGAFVLSHFSHMYPNGGSIYMIFFTSQSDAESAWTAYRRIWDAGIKACLREGGTMSHQHGIGLTRSTYTADELGSSFEVLRRIKEVLDPNGILNPGKMGLGVRE
ncbi:MAG TPA: FAD-binding oxidoreductase [Candidatus Thorarchaeota archaeon]|nr:MAG: FAD-binding oxidoreductase [Candidatus Thorarchaeota archaeon]HDD67235.1 FAD-binding oxidoreductase [Candidatus Thorarchaeota archaeon]